VHRCLHPSRVLSSDRPCFAHTRWLVSRLPGSATTDRWACTRDSAFGAVPLVPVYLPKSAGSASLDAHHSRWGCNGGHSVRSATPITRLTMLPYFPQPVLHLGPLPIQAFGITVAIALWLGMRRFEARVEDHGLDRAHAARLNAWLLIGGAAGAHLFSVLFYFPEKLRSDPWLLLRVWEDISSFGGMLGGLIGALIYFALRARELSRSTKLAYMDAIAYIFPVSLAIGRLGCALAHDHPGRVTSFPLAFSLSTASARDFIGGVYAAAGLPLPSNAATLGFHDLGFAELLFLSIVVIPLFRLWSTERQQPGFYLIAFAGLYLPVRFFLDTLRVADVRYFGLTPAQWVAAAIVPMLPFLLVQRRVLRLVLGSVVILATGWACTAGSR
jgi:phosphatidylglycerol---prolipoprotein diacylglyceryl transferase